MNRFEGEVIDVAPLTSSQWDHIDRVADRQSRLMWSKYVKGQQEHGGNCWEKPGMLAHAMDEAADLPVYLHTLSEQMRNLVSLLRNGEIETLAAADEIERWLHK